ncbi:MAG: F0F1 ATP synthase subunit A [bacterium]
MDFKVVLEHHILDRVVAWIRFAGWELPVSRHLLMMWIAGLLLVGCLPLIIRSRARFFSPFRIAVETVALFIRDEMVIPSLGREGARFTSYFCSLFFFILVCNLLGLVPFGATATGNISVTAGMAFTTFLLINFAGIKEQGLVNYLQHMVPKGVPGWLAPFIFLLEFLSMLTKIFALCIRLFANMISGHIVILSFMGLIFIFGQVHPLLGLGLTAPLAVTMILFVSLLEIFVAFLQAYIFTLLTAMFTGAAMHPH